MTQLDDLAAIDELDALDVLGAMEGFAEQLQIGWDLGNAVESLPSEEGVDSVAILGMGGSGSAGDIARVVAEPRIPVPFPRVQGIRRAALVDWSQLARDRARLTRATPRRLSRF